METAEPSVDGHQRRRSPHTDFLHLVDLRVLAQSELCSLAVSASYESAPNRCQDDIVIPKIDRSVFNESAGSRKQTYSRLRLAPRGKPPRAAPPIRASVSHIPLDEENTQIIGMLQNLFGVESLRTSSARDGGGANDGLVPVQVEFKQPESGTPAFQNVPIDVLEEGTARKRKRGRPRRNESPGALVIKEEEEPPQLLPLPQPQPKKAKDESLVEDVRDPFVEKVKRRTLGMETEAQVMEFLEGLKGEWGSDRKKRRVVEATELGSFLPSGWKVVLTLQKRAGRASVVCGRYVSPYGQQFVSFKEVSAYLLSFYGEDINLVRTSCIDSSLQFPSNMDVASGSVVGPVPTGEMKTDLSASCLRLASKPVHSHHEKQTTVPSSIEREKLNTSDGSFDSSLAWGCTLGDTTGRAVDRQTEDKESMMDDKDNASSVQGCSLGEDRLHNLNMVHTIEAIDAACNLYIPSAFSTPFPDNNSGIYQLPDEMNAVTCIKSNISNFAGGNEQAHVDNNGHGLSVRLVENHRHRVGYESSIFSPNSEGERFARSNLEDRHLINSQIDMEIRGRRPAKYANQRSISCNDQSENKDVSASVKLKSSSHGFSLVPSQEELKHTSINISGRIQTFMANDSAVGNFFDGDLPVDERTCFPRGYTHNVSLSACTKDAFEFGGVDIASNLSAAKDVSDNHAPPSEGLVTSFAREKNTWNGQNCKMDNLLQESSKSNLLTPFGVVDPSVFYDDGYTIPAGSFDALKAIDAGCKKPQLGTVSCSNDVAVDAYTNASIIQGRSQGCESVALGGSVLNLFDKQSMDGVNNGNKSCLPENAKSEQVDILRTNSSGMPGFR